MNLLRTLAAISSMTMLSRITGLLRDILFARAFGAGGLTDAYNIAFRLPNLLRRLFAEGAFSQAFVPILSEYKNKKTLEETRSLADHVGTTLEETGDVGQADIDALLAADAAPTSPNSPITASE